MPGVIIAGISGAGKTTMHRMVTAAATASGRENIIALPQAMTTTAHQHLNANPAAQAAAVLDWCDFVVSTAERLHTTAAIGGLMTERENYPFNWTPIMLLEGFIFDIPLHDLAIKREETIPLEMRLKELGIELVVLTVPPDKIRQQCIESTRMQRGAGWNSHLQTLGRDDDERAEHFRLRQESLLHWASTSPLRHHVLRTADADWAQLTETIMGISNARASRYQKSH